MVLGSSDDFASPRSSEKQAVLVFKILDSKDSKNVYAHQLGIKKTLLSYLPKAGIPVYPLDQADENWLMAHYGKDYLGNPNLPIEIKESPKRYLMNNCAYKFLIPAEQKLVLKMELIPKSVVPEDIDDFTSEQTILLEQNQILEVVVNINSDGKLMKKNITSNLIQVADTNLCTK